MIRSLPFAIAAAISTAAMAGPPWALQRLSDGAIVSRTYSGAPYAIEGYRWLDPVAATLAPVDSRIYARIPCSDIDPAARIDDADPDVVDCADSAGADELVVLLDPVPSDPAEVVGSLHTGLYQLDWQDTGDEPTQSLAALASLAEQHRRACVAAATYPVSCDDLGLVARALAGETLPLADQAVVSACADASRTCGSPVEANRARLEAEVRAAYASRHSTDPSPVPDLDVGWPTELDQP